MTTGPEAGYYADPTIPGYIRYWDGSQWVPGTSRPAPGAPTGEPDLSEQAVHQAAQVREQLVTVTEPSRDDQREAGPAQTESEPVEEAQSVATMVVPSAYGARGGFASSGYGGPGWSGTPGVSGYDASPYAAVPGLAGDAEAENAAEPDVTVVELASAGSRVLARIIDLGLAAVLSAPVTATLLLIAHRHDHAYVERLRLQAQTTYRTLGMDALGIGLWGAALIVLLVTAICFDAFRLGRSGQTTGRRLVGVRVVSADTAAEIGNGAAFARALLFWLCAILPVIDVIALGGVLWGRPYRQGLHEKLTRTISIRA